MQEEPESGGWREILLGVIVIVALIGAVYYSIRFVYETYFAPAPATISLSAYFVDDSGAPVSSDAPNYETSHLKVRGDVFRGGEAVSRRPHVREGHRLA